LPVDVVVVEDVVEVVEVVVVVVVVVVIVLVLVLELPLWEDEVLVEVVEDDTPEVLEVLVDDDVEVDVVEVPLCVLEVLEVVDVVEVDVDVVEDVELLVGVTASHPFCMLFMPSQGMMQLIWKVPAMLAMNWMVEVGLSEPMTSEMIP